jgi:hypothetical protein
MSLEKSLPGRVQLITESLVFVQPPKQCAPTHAGMDDRLADGVAQ